MLPILLAAVFVQEASALPAKIPDTSLALEVLKLTNAAREREGHPPLRLNEALTKAAQGHADDMAKRDYFDHVSPDGATMVIRIERVNYSYRGIAENIAMGQRNPKEAVASWLKSPGHRRNILNGSYRDLGVGVAKDKKGIPRWVQVFGAPR